MIIGCQDQQYININKCNNVGMLMANNNFNINVFSRENIQLFTTLFKTINIFHFPPLLYVLPICPSQVWGQVDTNMISI